MAGRDADAPCDCRRGRAAGSLAPLVAGARGNGARLLAFVALAVFGAYSVYTPFDAWWYLRFLLPAWPAVFIGTAALVIGLARGRAVWLRALGVLAVLALGLHASATARRLGVYPDGEGERRYATIAGLVARVTDRRASSSPRRTSVPCGITVGG